MDGNYLSCQVCLSTFKGVPGYKRHARSREHKQKMEEVFQKDKFKNPGFFPSIVLMDPVAKQDIKLPIVGLSQLTLCFSTETKDFFYLCHVCEERCIPDRIVCHFSSGDHCSNYFSYTNPNAVSFSWIPSTNRAILKPELRKEVNERGSGQLQMLELPENLLKKLETSTYAEVMQSLSENAKLLKLLKASQPARKMIETYQRDRNRKHPLLGIQHLIECICDGPTEKRHYLCTLCNLTLATHMIIRHVLSFDHIFCYFREWHPSTLKSKECYLNYSKPFADAILDLAKKTEEIHGTENTDMKQVSLEPQQFTSVNFTCYAEALKQLESITEDRNGSSLITIIKPGKTLESHLGGKDPSLCGPTPSLKLRCQDCSIIFDRFNWFKTHWLSKKHKEMLVKFFSRDEGADGYDQKEHPPNLVLFRYIDENFRQNRPVVGVPLVVTCVCTQHKVAPLYVCFACEESFYNPSLTQHFNSRKHLIRTMMYQNPWQLPFAWDFCPDVKILKSLAWQEERERGPNHIVLKVFDIPYWMFWGLTPVYQHVMERLKLQHTLLKSEVPRCETYTKLKEGERFPLLGQRFLVQYEVSVNEQEATKEAFLCLLCERKLLDEECHIHVIRREHVEKFLNRFHPGSLNSSTDAETLLDLAKQAGAIHSVSHVQVIDLDRPIWEPCPYVKTKSILAAAKRRQGKGGLEPQITPKMKLVPREKDSQKKDRMIEESEKKSGQSSTENSETTLKKISVEAGAEITKTPCGEKGADKETPTPNENKMEKMREAISKTSSEEINTAGSETCKAIKEEKAEEPTVETCQVIKEEKIEEPVVRKPSGETLESGQITDNADGTETGEERSKGVLTELKNNMHKENERKRTRSMSENSQKNTCPNEEVKKEMGHKRQRVTSKQDSSCQELQNPTDEGESGKPSIKTTKHEASSEVNDHQTVQLCQYLKRKSREPVAVPREKDSQKKDRMIEESEKKSGQSSTESSETTLKKISVEAGAEITKTPCGEKGADKETPTPNENKMEKMREAISKTSSEEINTAGSETCKVIKEEKIEEPVVRKPSGETLESGQITDNADGTETGEERSKGVLTELKNKMHKENERKRTRSMSENSQKNTCPNEEVKKEMGHKRQRVTSKQDSSCQELQNPTDQGESGKPSIKTTKHEASSDVNDQQTMQLWQYLKRKSREPAVGLGALLECCCAERDPIYLCGCCSLKIPEIDIISHVTGADHQKMYLMGSQRLSPPPGKLLNIRRLAAVFEQENGYGEAQVIDLDEDIYINISQQSFKSATQTVKALKAQWDRELHPASALSAVEPMDTSHTDNFQVVDMDVDEDASRLCVSTTGTSASCLLPDARVNDSKDEIISNATGGPLKMAATSKIVGASQNAAASDSALTSSTKSVTTISKCPAKTSSSTSHTTNLTAPISKLRATTSSCATTNPTTFTLRETAQKCVATTSSATVTAPKWTADNLNSSTTSKNENATKKFGTASQIMAASQTVVTSSDTPKMIKTSLKYGNAEAFAKAVCLKVSIRPNSDVAPDAPKSNTPAAPHQKTLMSQHKNPPTEASHTSTSKTKPSEGLYTVGRNDTIAVTCQDKQQIYCTVCSVKMRQSAHLSSSKHQYNYVKMTYPWWNAKPSEFQSKFNKTVAHLAEAEKNLGFRFQPKIDVSMKTYKELADLPDDKAMQRLQELMGQRPSRVTSPSSTTDNEEVLGQQVPFASPCEVSSPDYGMPQDEKAELSTDIQSEQEKNHEHQTPMVQSPEIESVSNEDGRLAAIQADRTQSLKSSEPEANNPISPQLHSCPPLNKNKHEAIAAPSSQLANITVNIKQETFECEVSQAMVEITPAVELPAIKVEKPHPLTTHSFAQTHNTYQEMAEKRQKQERSDPDLRDTHEVPKDPQETLPVKLFNPDPLPSAAAVNTEQQNQSRPIQEVEHVQKRSGCSPEPGKPSTSQARPKISIGKRSQTECSNLYRYLDVKGLASVPIIGWRSMWECQGISQNTFYLCESCSETITSTKICEHMVSEDHQINCIMMWHSQFMWFMQKENVNHCGKMEILKRITKALSTRECERDIQIVQLTGEWYKYIRTAPFSEALELVQSVKAEWTPAFLPLSAVLQKDQQPADWQSREQSPPTERRSTHALEPAQRDDFTYIGSSKLTDPRLKNRRHLEETVVAGDLDAVKQIRASSPLDVTRVSPKVDSVVPLLSTHALEPAQRDDLTYIGSRKLTDPRLKTDKRHLEETVVAGDLDAVKQIRASSPLDVTRVSPKVESVVPLLPGAGTCHSLQESCRSPSMQPELRLLISQHQKLFPDLQVKQEEVHSESPSSSVAVSHKTSLTQPVSPRDICLPARKHSADTSLEKLVRPDTSNLQPEDPLPAQVQSVSPPSSVLVSHKTSQTWSVSLRDVCLPARKSPADTSPETLVRLGINNPELEDPLPAISQASTESAAESPPVILAATSTHKDTGSGSEEQDALSVNYEDLADLLREMKSDPDRQSSMERRLDSKYVQTTCQMDKKQRKWDSKWQPMRATVKQQSFFTDSLEDTFSTVAPVVSGSENQLVALNASSLEGSSARGNILPRATEAKAVDNVLPSVSTTSQSDSQHQRDVTSHNPGLIPPPQGHTDTNSTGGCQLPFNPIITTRPEPPNKQFMGSHMGKEQAEVNTGKPVPPSSPTVATASPSEVPLAASGGYGQYNQMAYATNGHSGYLCSEANAHCATPDNPPEGYAAWGFYPVPIYPGQEPNHFGHSLATPSQSGWARMELQQQLMQQQQQQQHLMQQQQQHLMQQQQLIQQQLLSWTSVSGNNSQSYTNMNYQRITPMQNSNNMMSHNPPQVYLNPLVACYPPTPQSENHYFFPRAQGFFKLAPVSHETTP